jgi:hypothetical protein
MHPITKQLSEQENIISLRRAVVQDDGSLVDMLLMLADEDLLKTAGKPLRPKDLDWIRESCTYLYRHPTSPEDEKEMLQSCSSWQRGVRQMRLETPPAIDFLWSESGHTVVLCLDGEPWSFIDEETRKGYSKGVIQPAAGEPWSQRIFDKIVKKGLVKQR